MAFLFKPNAMYRLLLCLLICATFYSCNSNPSSESDATEAVEQKEKKEWLVPIKQLAETDYPDNPDWGTEHSDYDEMKFEHLKITKNTDGVFSFEGIPANDRTDNLLLAGLKIMEWIPSVPSWVLEDPYLTHIGVFNQEWNRHQVRFEAGEFQLKGNRDPFEIQRVDLARNCLNAYLWELIIYAEDKDGKRKVYYHGWFDFPKDLYADLFNQRNPSLDYEDYRKVLEDWVEPESKRINLALLRTVELEEELNFEDYQDQYYPLKGNRKSKFKNIVRPKKVTAITDYLNDSTLFSTFSAPGFYDTNNPAKTELGRFSKLEKVVLRKTIAKNSAKTDCLELEYHFRHKTDNKLTRFIVGGITADRLQKLSIEETYKGWQMPMGVGNHSFYEPYNEQQARLVAENPYFAFLLDEEGNWLDSHGIGIDGPLFHLDENKENWLHLWILSFERHAFVGHIGTDISKFIPTQKLVQ